MAEGVTENNIKRPQVCGVEQCPVGGGHSVHIHTPSSGAICQVRVYILIVLLFEQFYYENHISIQYYNIVSTKRRLY